MILNWFVQLCFAVKYIHDKYILHRDIKLSNIFLCSNGDIKLGDFGTSKLLTETNRYADSTVGTPYYLSPEICKKNQYRDKSDIWSMGCVLFELMNLKHAFEAGSKKKYIITYIDIAQLVMKIINGQFELIEDNYSEELKSLLKEMLCVDPEKRPDINQILKRPYLVRYIKLNVIRIISHNKYDINENERKSVRDNYEDNANYKNVKKDEIIRMNGTKENKTRTSSLNENILNSNHASRSKNESDNFVINIYQVDPKIYHDNQISDPHSSFKKNNSNLFESFTNTHSKPENIFIYDDSSKIIEYEKNSTFCKIEKLKKLLEDSLGLDNFLELYSKIYVIK